MRKEEKGVDLPLFCQQCEDAPCIGFCPVGAIYRNITSQLIEIDEPSCTKCQNCVTECPYKGICFDGVDGVMINCDLCGGDPQCVKFCESKAIQLLERDSIGTRDRKEAVEEFKKLLKAIEKDLVV